MDWIMANKEWIFSGIGVFIIATVGAILFARRKATSSKKMTQESGHQSTNLQAGGDMNIGNKTND